MPRASWKGFLRLSLVSCPIYLSPATTRTKSIRLHQVWHPKATRSAPIEDEEEEEQPSRLARRSFLEELRGDAQPERPSPTRVALYPHDRRQASLLLPGSGKREDTTPAPATARPRRRKA